MHLAALLTTISAALIYATGTQYYKGYFDYFGISLSEINLPLQELSAAAIVPAAQTLDAAVSLLFIWIVLLFWAISHKKEIHVTNIATSALIHFTVWMIISLTHAHEYGKNDAISIVKTLPIFLVSDRESSNGFSLAIPEGRTTPRLLFATKDTYFVYGDRGSPEERWTIRIQRDRIPSSAATF